MKTELFAVRRISDGYWLHGRDHARDFTEKFDGLRTFPRESYAKRSLMEIVDRVSWCDPELNEETIEANYEVVTLEVSIKK